MFSHLPEKSGLDAARVALSLLPVFWGLALVGVATWLLSRQAPGAALPCFAFSAGYFWFAWSIYNDATWKNEEASRGPHEFGPLEFPVFEPRSWPEPSGLNRHSRVFHKAPRPRKRPRASRDRVA